MQYAALAFGLLALTMLFVAGVVSHSAAAMLFATLATATSYLAQTALNVAAEVAEGEDGRLLWTGLLLWVLTLLLFVAGFGWLLL
jgi:hypothetical protein